MVYPLHQQYDECGHESGLSTNYVSFSLLSPQFGFCILLLGYAIPGVDGSEVTLKAEVLLECAADDEPINDAQILAVEVWFPR